MNAADMTSGGTPHYDDGVTAAARELASGYPGYFYSPGPGSFVCDVDRQAGLPIFCFGDAMNDRFLAWIDGFNAGVKQHIREHRLPWNCRKAWLPLLEDIPGYFQSRLKDRPPLILSQGASTISSPD